jgi:hypothetical protein
MQRHATAAAAAQAQFTRELDSKSAQLQRATLDHEADTDALHAQVRRGSMRVRVPAPGSLPLTPLPMACVSHGSS